MDKKQPKYVLCYQKFKDEALTDTPYEMMILADLGSRWALEGPIGEVLRAHKGACSSKPYSKRGKS